MSNVLSNERHAKIDSNLEYVNFYTKYNKKIVEHFLHIKHSCKNQPPYLPVVYWNFLEKCWKVPISGQNLLMIAEIIDKWKFTPCEKLLKLINTRTNNEPILAYHDDQFYYKNSQCLSFDMQPECIDHAIISSSFSGVKMYDDNIQSKIDSGQVNSLISTVSQHYGKGQLYLDNRTKLKDFNKLFRYTEKSLFVIPYHNEMNIFGRIHRELNLSGILDEEISVLFRLPNPPGLEFNQYVKNKQLNNQAQTNTRALFIREKIPKQLKDLDPHIDIIFVVNSVPRSYIIQQLLEYHPCVINVKL
jgi:hypothetical protein